MKSAGYSTTCSKMQDFSFPSKLPCGITLDSGWSPNSRRDYSRLRLECIPLGEDFVALRAPTALGDYSRLRLECIPWGEGVKPINGPSLASLARCFFVRSLTSKLDGIKQKSPIHFRGRGHFCFAEGVGFEPTIRVNVCRFSRPVHSTRLCHPSLLKASISTHVPVLRILLPIR